MNTANPVQRTLNNVFRTLGVKPKDDISLEDALQRILGFVPEEFSEDRELPDAEKNFSPKIVDLIEPWKKESVLREQISPVGEETGISISYFPQDAKATVYIAACTDCDIDEAIGQLRLMQKRLAMLRKRGYDVSKAQLVHEDQTTDSKRYEIDIPLHSQFELDQIVKDLKEIGMPGSKYSKTLADQLQKLFPKADGRALERIICSVDAQIKHLRKTTDNTYTGVVLDFEIDGKRIYCKIGDKTMLAKEAQYHRDASEHQLMRAITPKLIGLVDDKGMAGLFTYGTENLDSVHPADWLAYSTLQKTLIGRFAKTEKCDPEELEKDFLITDMFNRAIAHTYMKDHINDPIYKTAVLDSVVSKEKLEERLCSSKLDKNGISEVISLFPLFSRIAEEVAEFDKKPIVLAHYDARTENIFPSRFFNRPMGDFGTVKPGTPEFDLGKMEVPNTDFYVKAYAFFRNALEQEAGNNFELNERDIAILQDKVRKVGFVNALKLACYKSSRGLNPRKYLDLSTQYAKLLQ